MANQTVRRFVAAAASAWLATRQHVHAAEKTSLARSWTKSKSVRLLRSPLSTSAALDRAGTRCPLVEINK